MNTINESETTSNSVNRRDFITTIGKATGAAALLSLPIISEASHFVASQKSITVGEVMNLFIKQVPDAPFDNTVDTLKSGNRDIVVTGIVTTMFATIDVIQKAIAAKANFIIAHEPTFYNHEDKTDWLQDNDVYQYKKDLLQNNNIAVWRNHDYVHSLQTDGVREGVLERLGWKTYAQGDSMKEIQLPPASLQSLIQHTKKSLGIKQVRYIGDLSQSCKNVLLMVGAAGGKTQITMTNKIKPDVLMAGEISEWETAEYIRDARAKGDNISLVVLGHIASEEPGSEWMLRWLKQNVAGVPAVHIPAENSLSFA